MYCIIYSNELCHHGIKGQKWGVRRFQNEDGSYTEAGRKRYGRNEDRVVYKYNKSGEKGSAGLKRAPKANTNGDDSQKRGMSKGTKTALIVGGAVAATALAAVGGYTVYKWNEDKLRGTKIAELASKGFDAAKRFNNYKGPVQQLREQAAGMSDAELTKQIKRLTAENQFVKAKTQQLNDPKESRWDGITKALGAAGATAATVSAIRDALKKNRGDGVPDPSGMSDKELREYVNRANLENQYRNLHRGQSQNEQQRRGRAETAIDVAKKGVTAADEAESVYRRIRRRRGD